MNFTKKTYWLLLAGIFLVYCLLRLPSLTLMPVFCDEAIYIHWAQKILANVNYNAFVSLTDGKTPLFMWLDAPLQFFFSDPLFAGRILSVISGLFTVAGAVVLGNNFFNRRVGLIAGFLIAVIPLTVFFDKTALTDSMLATFSIWSLLFALDLVQRRTVKNVVLLGLTLGCGILVKTPGIFSFVTLPIVFLSFNFKKEKFNGFIKSATYLLSSSIIGSVIYNVLRFSPDFSLLSSRNQDYYFPFSRLLTTPFNPFIPHLRDLGDWLPKMVTWPILILITIAIVLSIYKKDMKSFAIFLWGLLPLLAMMSLLKTFTARYILFAFVPMIFLAGQAMDYVYNLLPIKNKVLPLIVVTALLLIPAFSFDYYLSTDPQKAPLPAEERRGYLEDWTAGYGLKGIAKTLNEEAKKQKLVVVTDGFFGTLPDGLQIYLKDNTNIEVWYSVPTLGPEVYDIAKAETTYFVANKSRLVANHNLKLIAEYPRAKGTTLPQDALLLYQVLP